MIGGSGRTALAAASFGGCVLFALTQERPFTYLLLAVFLSIVALPFWSGSRGRVRPALDGAEPIYGLSVLYLIYFGVRSIYVLRADWDPRLAFLPWIDPALTYAIIGVLALQVGYRSRLGTQIAKSLPQLKTDGVVMVSPKMFYALWSLVLLSRLYLMTMDMTQRFMSYAVSGEINAVAYFSSSLARVVFALGAVTATVTDRHTGRWFKLVFWAVVLPLELSWTVFGGEKKLIIYTLAIVLLAHHYLRRPLKFSWMLCAAAAALAVLFPIVNSYRNRVYLEASGPPAHRQDYLSGVNDSSGIGLTSRAVELGTQMIWRFPGIDSLAVEIQEVPRLQDVHMGLTIVRKLSALVPAIVLPDKNEIIGIGSLFNRNIYGDWVFSDLPMMLLGELYYNFHVFGVVFGMFFFGLTYRAVYCYFITVGKARLLFIYLPLLMLILNIESDIGILASEAIRQCVFGMGVAVLVAGGQRGQPRVARSRMPMESIGDGSRTC